MNYTPSQQEIDGSKKIFFYTPMPGKRADGQVLIGAALEADMIALMDKARGGISRSQYVRQAIAEKLISEGYKVPSVWIFSPDRTGKGGRPKKKVEITQHGSHSLAIGGDFKLASGAHAQKPVKKPKGKRGKGKSDQ